MKKIFVITIFSLASIFFVFLMVNTVSAQKDNFIRYEKDICDNNFFSRKYFFCFFNGEYRIGAERN